jgi:hypothetical protein
MRHRISFRRFGVTIALPIALVLTSIAAVSSGNSVTSDGLRKQAAGAGCAGDLVTIVAPSEVDYAAVCLGAHRAGAFLEQFGLRLNAPITVKAVDNIAPVMQTPLLGLYNPKTQTVKVLSRAALKAGTNGDKVFSVPIDADVHAGIFTHEIVHAILDQNTERFPLSRAGHEYLAYAIQLATLPVGTRERILASHPVSGFDTVDQVSDILLGFDPDKFGVNAYLHFRDAGDQAAVFNDLVRLSRAAEYGWY